MSPVIFKAPVKVKESKVGLAFVATDCPILIVPLDIPTPVPAVKAPCALAFVKYKFELPSLSASVLKPDRETVASIAPSFASS